MVIHMFTEMLSEICVVLFFFLVPDSKKIVIQIFCNLMFIALILFFLDSSFYS